MKLPKLAALLMGAALFITGCSATGGAPRGTSGGEGGGTVDTPRLVVAMVSHGAPGDTFWDLVRKGAEDAAQKDNIELRYSSHPEVPDQANLVQNAIDSQVDGIAMTMPNAQALGPVAQRAVDAGIPVVGLNAGMNEYQDYGMTGFFGQDESVAGTHAGERLAEEGAQKVLCVIHEQGNSSQEARCDGVSQGLGQPVETLYVNGMDLTSVNSTLQAKLAQDRRIDWVMGLQAGVSMAISDAAEAANSEVKIATFDTNAQLMTAIRDGRIQFAIDQQPYLQGYMAVDSLWLAHRNGTTVGGGQPVYTGPAIVDISNVDVISDAVAEGLR
ncbi:ABC transporter periplasmic component [Corynebacterium deserti GIMN1.010]|uniref:ABC transporter periplasmic component n=1 Tax=Corynebacterium deserti GIMN1.010 TaxID=931089 RepID=A0A0M4CH98_9CORY|nr:substrate-binding domain-containing protein [Corynebacterium deserti]ALC04514.1 ABC transporter periplasmic component [Corynebacterium deserti GIMN1.010]